ncbi:hypothetical protein SCHPADRAFT_592926 [Schizopora paradoxa]|uniref:Uncharacterized protein n=1 Tax=Schizopora paradoxa TaxID=27342 RepID=A0A0H2RBM6_9AGAM|nr:hypothetical protein SCHPADRAFT_592926 [Schizopora paradoxa]
MVSSRIIFAVSGSWTATAPHFARSSFHILVRSSIHPAARFTLLVPSSARFSPDHGLYPFSFEVKCRGAPPSSLYQLQRASSSRPSFRKPMGWQIQERKRANCGRERVSDGELTFIEL